MSRIRTRDGLRPHHGLRTRRGICGVVLAGALALTACQAPVDTPDSPGGESAGGTAVLGVTSDPDTLMPWQATQFQAVDVLSNIYGSLTQYD